MELYAEIEQKEMVEGELKITLSIKDFVSKEKANTLETGNNIKIKLNQIKDKRTLAQNRLLWELIGEIAEYINDEEMNVYCTALERANEKYEYMKCYPSVVKVLAQNFRAVKVLNYVEEDGIIYAMVKCFTGSSKFDKKEIDSLIQILYLMGTEYGMEFRYGKEV